LKNHKLLHIPPTKKNKPRTWRCRVCIQKNIKKEARFVCAHCGVPLHTEGCYTRYHTMKHY
jgi:5-methylcytosine-specific restriction endonuclease McrA